MRMIRGLGGGTIDSRGQSGCVGAGLDAPSGGTLRFARRPALPKRRPWSHAALAMLAAVVAVAVGQGLPSEARADHYQFNVTVEKSPSEGGTVTGDGIDCGTDCTGTFAHAVVCDELGCWDTYSGILSATPAPGYAVEGWTGCQGGSSGVWCFVMGDGSDQTVTARFRKAECSDASDNDSDGKVDHPADPDCESPSDDSEAYTPPPDTTPPPLTVTPESIGPTNDPTPTVEFSSTEPGVKFNCYVLDDSPGEGTKHSHVEYDCTSPYTTPSLTDGPWRIVVWAEDASGNFSREYRPLTVDTGPPDTTITSGPSGTVRSTTASFGFSSSESGSTFECGLDGAPFTACTSPKDYSALSQGGHTLEVADRRSRKSRRNTGDTQLERGFDRPHSRRGQPVVWGHRRLANGGRPRVVLGGDAGEHDQRDDRQADPQGDADACLGDRHLRLQPPPSEARPK
jgi:uncharacterized repeat protein (TIGR02543 family)